MLRGSPAVYLSNTIVNLLGLVLPLSILQVYDRVIPNLADATLGAIIGILLVTIVSDTVLRLSRQYSDGFNAAKFSHNISVDALDRILHADQRTFASEPARKTLDRLDAIGRLGSYFGGSMRQVAIDLPFSLVFFAAIALIGGYLVLIPIAITIVFGAATILFGRVLAETVERKDAQDIRNFDFITEVLSGISTVKALSSESLMMRRFERLKRGSARHTHYLIIAADRAQIMAGTLGNLTTIAMVTVGAILAIDGLITIGTLAACSMLSGRAVQPILRVAGTWNEYQRIKLTLQDVAEIFAMPEVDATARDVVISTPPDVEIRDMSYDPGANRIPFAHLSLHVPAQSIVCLCGPDGVGKSTLLRLIAGTIKPDSGAITIGDMPAHKFRQNYRNAIGYVSPETEIFNGTILENLTLFGAGAKQPAALAAASQIGLEEEIYRFPDGYATRIGASAVETMPKAFIRRLLIARAIAQKPGLLILDEAQAFLDSRSDGKLRECIRDLQMDTTIIIVTNQRDYIQMADRVFDLAPGRITERAAETPPQGSRA
ncbi:MAG: ABC transporter transmembrane domain-containing protein [Pseudomonadota bacterium]